MIKQGARLVQDWNDVIAELPPESRRHLIDKGRKKLLGEAGATSQGEQASLLEASTAQPQLDATARRVLEGKRYWLTSARRGKVLWDVNFASGDWIIVGRETAGLPAKWMEAEPERVVTIPQVAGERCLNQATAAGIITFEALRQLSYSTN